MLYYVLNTLQQRQCRRSYRQISKSRVYCARWTENRYSHTEHSWGLARGTWGSSNVNDRIKLFTLDDEAGDVGRDFTDAVERVAVKRSGITSFHSDDRQSRHVDCRRRNERTRHVVVWTRPRDDVNAAWIGDDATLEHRSVAVTHQLHRRHVDDLCCVCINIVHSLFLMST